MESDDRWAVLLALDEELLKGDVMLSEWCALIVNEADTAFATGSYLASILTAVSGIETYLRAEYLAGRDERLAELIENSDLASDLKADLHRLRHYRNRWVHVKAPADDEALLTDPAPVDRELEVMAYFAARTLRRTIYSVQGV